MINISETAAGQIKAMLAEQEVPDMFLRLGVTAGGAADSPTLWASMIPRLSRTSTWTLQV